MRRSAVGRRPQPRGPDPILVRWISTGTSEQPPLRADAHRPNVLGQHRHQLVGQVDHPLPAVLGWPDGDVATSGPLHLP